MRIIAHQHKALKIYKEVKRIKKEALERLEKRGFFDELGKNIKKVFLKEKLDGDTVHILKLLFTQRGELSEEDKIKQIMLKTLDEVFAKDDEQQYNLTLSRDGNLYRGNLCYPMKREGQRLKIIKLLDATYIETDQITEKVGAKNNEATRKAVGIINQKAKSRLKLESPLIESKAGCGYRINYLYTLTKE